MTHCEGEWPTNYNEPGGEWPTDYNEPGGGA